VKEETKNIDLRLVGKESLVYNPSQVSWSISEHVSRENPILERIVVYTMLSIFFLVIVYTLIAKVAISTKTAGSLEYENSSVVLINENDLTVEKLFFKPNATVKKGDILLQGKGQLSVANLIKMKKSKEDIMKMIEMDEVGKCGNPCIRQLEQLSETTFAFEQNLSVKGTFKDYLQRITTEFKSYLNALRTRQSLDASTGGLRNQIRNTQDKIRKIVSRGSQDVLRMELNQLKTELANLQSQLKERTASTESNIDQNRNVFKVSINNLGSNINDYVDNNQVRAQNDGVLVYLEKVSEGQFIGARTKIFQVIPVGGQLIGKALISNKDISTIQKGLKVKISVDALPEREYSSAWGVVDFVSIEPKEDPQTKELKYEIWITLDRQSLEDYKGDTQYFKLGMTYKAEIITTYKSLFRVAISKLLNIKDEYLGDYL
jgi:multidrug efflux pump subunit AcrA (membrane-fusion protein)